MVCPDAAGNWYQPIGSLNCVVATYNIDNRSHIPFFNGTVVSVYNYANYGAVDSVVAEPEDKPQISQSIIDDYLEKPCHEWFKKSIEIFILEEGQSFVKDFAQWLNSREEQFIYAPIQELLLSNGLNHPQVKMFFQAWLNETQDLKAKYSRDLFMKEESYKTEQVKGELRLTCKGRIVKL